jgi:hypothetical protein
VDPFARRFRGGVHAAAREMTQALNPEPPTRVEDLRQDLRLETRFGDLDIMQWVAGIETDPAYEQLAARAIAGEHDGIPLRVYGLDDLIAMKRATGRPRDLDDLQRLGAAPGA